MRLEEAKSVYNTDIPKPKPIVDTNLPPNMKKTLESKFGKTQQVKNKSLSIPLAMIADKEDNREDNKEDIKEEKKREQKSTKDMNLKPTTTKNKRNFYQNNKRKSTAMNQVSSFMNVFNSFVGDELKPRNKTRRSSILLTARNESSKKLLPLDGTRKYYNKRKPSKNKLHLLKIYSKNRSKSLVPCADDKYTRYTLRRTLSDFHECPHTKSRIAVELFTGINVFKSQITKKKTMNSLDDNSLDRCSSVSETSNGMFV